MACDICGYIGCCNFLVSVLQLDLILYYRALLSKPLKEDRCDLTFCDCYVKPIVTFPSDQGPNGQSTLVPTLHDIFEKNSQPCKNIFITSPACYGKTSFLKYLTLVWCQAHQPNESDNQWLLEDVNEMLPEDVKEMRTFTLLFFLYLRESDEIECNVDNMIQKQLILQLDLQHKNKYANSKFLKKLLSKVKCITLLDGLDEWNHPKNSQCTCEDKHIPYHTARSQWTILTTSRPWKLENIDQIDQKLEIHEFEEDLLKKLVQRAVKHMNTKYQQNKNERVFLSELEKKKLNAVSNFPYVVMQLLTLWYDSTPFENSQCKIYTNMIELYFEHHFKKRHNYSETENRNVEASCRDQHIPVCFQSSQHVKTHVDLLSKLGELAFNTLFGIVQKSSYDEKLCLEIGILTQANATGGTSEGQSNISFLHKIFQDFLAALYVTMRPDRQVVIVEMITHVCCTIKTILDMSQFFISLSGLCPEVISVLYEPLRHTVSNDTHAKKYRSSCKLGLSSNEGQILKGVQMFLMDCLDEYRLNGHKHAIKLPVSDFFIGDPGSPWSNELKDVIAQNHVRSMHVVDNTYCSEVIKDILKSVTVFSCIQKLWLLKASESFVVQLVSQHRCSLNVKPESWKCLEYVTLEMVDISGDTLCSLVDTILQLPKSVYVSLIQYNISHGTRDWKSYILEHHLLNAVDSINGYQFHTKKV